MKQIKNYLGQIIRLLPEVLRYKKLLAQVALALSIHRLAKVFISVLSSALIATLAASAGVQSVHWWLLVVIVILTFVSGISWWLDMWFAHVYAYKIIANLRVKVYDAIDRRNPLNFQGRTTGEVAAGAMSDLETTEWFYAHTFVDLLINMLMSLLFTGGMVWLTGWPGIFLFPIMWILMLFPLLTIGKQGNSGKEIRQSLAAQKAHCLETLQATREIIGLGIADIQLEKIKQNTCRIQRQRRKYLLVQAVEQAGAQIFLAVVTIGILSLLLRQVQQGVIPMTHVPIAMVLLTVACGDSNNVANMVRKMGEVSAATARYFALVDYPCSIVDTGTYKRSDCKNYDIELENISFAYESDVSVLQNLTLHVPTGSSLVLAGRTGSGKSTLASLIARLFAPQAGSIKIGGRDIASFNLEQLRTIVTFVAQSPYIFRASIRENLLLAKPQAPEKELWEALEKARISEFIKTLPAGLDTLVGERASTLSGGQKQRLCLAQAFLRDAPILILDEATSNLDPDLDKQLAEILQNSMKGKTIIVIAHRLSTIKRAKCIAFLADGKVVAQGKHSELLAKVPAYRDLITGN